MPRKPAPPARSTGSAGRKSVPLSQVPSKPAPGRRKPYGEEVEVKPEEDLEDFDDDDEVDDDAEEVDDEVDDFSDDDDE